MGAFLFKNDFLKISILRLQVTAVCVQFNYRTAFICLLSLKVLYNVTLHRLAFLSIPQVRMDGHGSK